MVLVLALVLALVLVLMLVLVLVVLVGLVVVPWWRWLALVVPTLRLPSSVC